jgi:hypothetical protein
MASMGDVEEEFGDESEDEVDESEALIDDAEIGDLDDGEIEDLETDVDLDDLDEETRNELKVVDEVLSQKEQNARSLAIRRAIEQRIEERRLHDDLDYLDD